MQKVLYLGMSDDIITPLLLFPDFDKLYIIDRSRDAFNLEDLFDGIKEMLITGKTLNIPFKNGDDCEHIRPTSIGGKCRIIKDRRTHNNKRWMLYFKFNGKNRKLIRYEQDFYNNWPTCMRNINHIIAIYSVPWDCLIVDHIRSNKKPTNGTHYLRDNVEKHVSLPFTWTCNANTHGFCTRKIAIINGRGHYMLIAQNPFLDPSRSAESQNEEPYFTEESRTEYLSQMTIKSFNNKWYMKFTHLKDSDFD